MTSASVWAIDDVVRFEWPGGVAVQVHRTESIGVVAQREREHRRQTGRQARRGEPRKAHVIVQIRNTDGRVRRVGHVKRSVLDLALELLVAQR